MNKWHSVILRDVLDVYDTFCDFFLKNEIHVHFLNMFILFHPMTRFKVN